MSHQIDLKTSACTMAAAGDDDDWVYIDGDQETTASPAPAPAVVCASDSLDESEHRAFDLKLLADLDYLTRKKASRITMDVGTPAPDDAATEVVAAADAVGDGAVDDNDAAEDKDDCSDCSNGGRLEKAYQSDQDLGQVDDESERLRGLLDNLKTIESKLVDCQRELLNCQKSIQDHHNATRDAPAPAPSAHGYNACPSSASSYSSYDGYLSGGYGTSSGYDGNGYGGLSDYDYGGLGYYYYPNVFGIKYGMAGGGGYGIGSGYRYGGGILDYGYRYGRNGGHYSDFDYGGLGDHYSSSSGNSYGYRPEDYGQRYRRMYWPGCKPGVGMYPAQPAAWDPSYPAQPAGSQYGYMDLPRVSSVVTDARAPAAGPEPLP